MWWVGGNRQQLQQGNEARDVAWTARDEGSEGCVGVGGGGDALWGARRGWVHVTPIKWRGWRNILVTEVHCLNGGEIFWSLKYLVTV